MTTNRILKMENLLFTKQPWLLHTIMLKFHNLERKMKSRYPRGLLKKINRNAVLLNELLEF